MAINSYFTIYKIKSLYKAETRCIKRNWDKMEIEMKHNVELQA